MRRLRSIALVLSFALLSAGTARAEDPAPQQPAPATAPATTTSAPPADQVNQPAAATPSPAPEATTPQRVADAPKPSLVDDGPVSKLRLGAWVGVALTVAVLTAGSIFGLAAQSRGDEVSRRLIFVDQNNQPRAFDESAKKDDENLRKEGKLYNGLAIGFYSAAGALAVVTTALFVVDATRKSKRRAKVMGAPLFTQGGAGLSIGGSF